MIEINTDIAQKLNEQVTSEANASNIYLQMSLWCEDRGLEGSAKFFRQHVAEELDHRDRIVNYMIESGIPVTLSDLPAPKNDYNNLVEVVDAAYKHEVLVTEEIHTLASMALDVRDFNTFNMLQWFIAEQREELMLFRSVQDFLEKAAFTGEPGDQLVNVDAYLGSLEHE
ncbi:MAG: ferritin [Candidatus Nanopelagicales bacterium]